MITVEETKLSGVLLIKSLAFEDHRGEYVEIYNHELYRNHGIDLEFIQDDISVSTRHVLRGIHGDQETWKLVSCLHGKFYLIVANCDPQSPGFRTWQSFVLSETNKQQVLIPPKHDNGHLVISDKAIFHYKQTTYYNPAGQFTYKWNDPKLKLWWPINNPILSRRDETGAFLK
jgi:dTDP-4-dehydrorhamnose 3,5-epimerase